MENLAELSTVGAADEDNCFRYVASLNNWFKLDKESVEVADGITIVSATGGGNWIRVAETDPESAVQVDWFVDPLAGDDENPGTLAAPLRTLRELSRRLATVNGYDLKNVILLNDVTDPTDRMRVNALVNLERTSEPFGRPPVSLRIQGQRTTLATFALDSASPPNILTPPSGESALINSAGFDFSPYIGRHVEVMDSANAASIGLIAVIVAAPALGIARISPFVSPVLPIPFVNVFAAPAPSYPSAGSTLRIYGLTSWSPEINMGAPWQGVVEIYDIDYTVAPPQTLANPETRFVGCVIRRPVRPGSSSAEPGAFVAYVGCSTIFPAPPVGRTPTQIPVTAGEVRYFACGFVDVDLRLREKGTGNVIGDSAFQRSLITCGGPNDAGRVGSLLNTFFPGTFGAAFMFDWPARNTLAPAPAMTRGTYGAAVDIGHRTAQMLTGGVWGSSSEANTTGFRLHDSGTLCVATPTSGQNPPPPSPPFQPPRVFRLNLTGADPVNPQILLDDQTNHIPGDEKEAALTGGPPATLQPLGTWAQWENDFDRNVVSEKSAARIINSEF